MGDDPETGEADPEKLDISIHVPRVGDDISAPALHEILTISIHVPRVGDDPVTLPPGAGMS